MADAPEKSVWFRAQVRHMKDEDAIRYDERLKRTMPETLYRRLVLEEWPIDEIWETVQRQKAEYAALQSVADGLMRENQFLRKLLDEKGGK